MPSNGSVHVQTDDQAAVEKAVARFGPRLVRSRATVVSAPANGWIGVYDESAAVEPDRLRKLASELSYVTGGVVIALSAERGAVVRLVAFERGQMMDEYLSVPEYYGALPPGDAMALRANPTLLSRLTGAEPAAIRAVARVADSPAELPSPDEHFAQLAEVLGSRRRPEPRRSRAARRRGGGRALLMKVVLLHAFPLDERMWEPQRAALAEHEVVAPNLYDLGGNSIDGWAGRILDDEPGDLAAVGASMGGYVALAMARQAPERIRGLLLAGSRPDADTPERRAGRADTINLIEEDGAEGLWENQREKLFAEEPPGSAREMALDRSPDELVRGVEALRDRADSSGLLTSLEVPVVFGLGAGDLFLSVEEAAGFATQAPLGRLVVFERSRHLPNLEEPAEFNQTLLELLASAG